MSGIVLSNPVSRGQDDGFDILWISTDYGNTRVVVHCVYTPSGTPRNIVFEGPSLADMRKNVTNFSGLKSSMLQYIQTLDASLSGSVT